MTAQLEVLVLTNGLASMASLATHITVNAGEPTTYALAVSSSTAYMLGYNSFGAGSAIGQPSANGSLQQCSTTAVTAGTITQTGTAAWWALVDEVHSSLYAHGSLSSSQVVSSGNTFSLASFAIAIPQH